MGAGGPGCKSQVRSPTPKQTNGQTHMASSRESGSGCAPGPAGAAGISAEREALFMRCIWGLKLGGAADPRIMLASTRLRLRLRDMLETPVSC